MEGEIRLVNGSNMAEGRLEICLNDEWGSVCNEMWDARDATVVCRELRLSTSGKQSCKDKHSDYVHIFQEYTHLLKLVLVQGQGEYG